LTGRLGPSGTHGRAAPLRPHLLAELVLPLASVLPLAAVELRAEVVGLGRHLDQLLDEPVVRLAPLGGDELLLPPSTIQTIEMSSSGL
jgi:hypothetical protein